MSEFYDIAQVYCEGTAGTPHPRVPAATFHRNPGERWRLSGMPELWPPSSAPVFDFAGTSVFLDGDTRVPISARRVTRMDWDVPCPLPGCHVHGYWQAGTVQVPLSALADAIGTPVGRYCWWEEARVVDVSLRDLDRLVTKFRRGD